MAGDNDCDDVDGVDDINTGNVVNAVIKECLLLRPDTDVEDFHALRPRGQRRHAIFSDVLRLELEQVVSSNFHGFRIECALPSRRRASAA